jgi:hypothetical protein
MTRKSASPAPQPPAAPAPLPARGGSFALVDGRLVPEASPADAPEDGPETAIQTPVEGGL